MGIDNPVHIVFIGIVALLVLGPKRLPEVARALGHGLREFREAVSNQGEPPQTPLSAQPQATQTPVPVPVEQPATHTPLASAPVELAPADAQTVESSAVAGQAPVDPA
jgi:sec-independent protein translocase protein TatA